MLRLLRRSKPFMRSRRAVTAPRGSTRCCAAVAAVMAASGSPGGDRSVGQVTKDFDLTETAVREWV
jgi:hypothetical protein